MASLRDEIGDFVGIPNSFIEDEQQTAESRVVFMLLRYHTHRKRKRAFPGFDTLMRETGLKRQKTAEGIAVLVKTGWLVKHRQFGKPTEYELRYPSAHDSSTGELSESATIVPQADHDSSTGGSTPLITTKIEFTKSNENRGRKVYKSAPEPLPPKTPPPPYYDEAFLEKLKAFTRYRKKAKRPLEEDAAVAFYADLAALGSSERAIAEMDRAMSRGWLGIIPEKQETQAKRGLKPNGLPDVKMTTLADIEAMLRPSQE